MAYKYVISKLGKNDYSQIAEYLTKTISKTYAIKVGRAIIQKIKETCKDPKLFQVRPEPQFYRRGIRAMFVEGYSIFYSVDDENETLHILRIRSDKQDNSKLRIN